MDSKPDSGPKPKNITIFPDQACHKKIQEQSQTKKQARKSQQEESPARRPYYRTTEIVGDFRFPICPGFQNILENEFEVFSGSAIILETSWSI